MPKKQPINYVEQNKLDAPNSPRRPPSPQLPLQKDGRPLFSQAAMSGYSEHMTGGATQDTRMFTKGFTATTLHDYNHPTDEPSILNRDIIASRERANSPPKDLRKESVASAASEVIENRDSTVTSIPFRISSTTFKVDNQQSGGSAVGGADLGRQSSGVL